MTNSTPYEFSTDSSSMLSISAHDVDAAVPYIITNKVTRLRIGYGFDQPNVKWSLLPLRDCLSLKDLSISCDFHDFKDITHLNLDSLSVDLTCSKEKIPLDSFTGLRDLSIMHYSSRVTGLQSCDRLESLQIWNYKSKSGDLSELCGMNSLKHLTLIRPGIFSLQGIEVCCSVREIKLGYSRQLADISSLQYLSKLQKLELYNCKHIHDFSYIAKLPELQFLIIEQCGTPKDLIDNRSKYKHIWINK